ncbi:MAG TPA: polyamine aminopropyltransferase [Oligoflexia bacterium]|nr:polyamine aminopropyltransferase [Oligoflexia bacterium]HMP49306.1 polyamine aminopropyltransferase [Oligoflexia bacterium]
MRYFLLLSVCVVAICGLVYELIAATIASYLLGDSITHFSTIIGTYLFSMGIGSYLSRFVRESVLRAFIRIELIVACLGGFSALILYALFPLLESLYIPLYGLVVLVGTGVGAEIPLLMRILKEDMEFSDLVSTVLSFDYIGALLASILFPLVCIPMFGIVKTSLIFGVLNAIIAFLLVVFAREKLRGFRFEVITSSIVIFALCSALVMADDVVRAAETASYNEQVILSKSSPYQRLVVTRSGNDTRLYLNGQLQFSSRDEYRYHEALVHVGLGSVLNPENVLILGGGDGFAAREVLRYDTIKSIVLVDLDPAVVELFKSNKGLSSLSSNALSDKRLEIVHEDAFSWIRKTNLKFDFIIIDLPDPTNFSLGKLYSDYFYRNVSNLLNEDGLIVVQATSPLFARESFWMIAHTLQSVGLIIKPYHLYVPSFTEWGFILGGKKNYTIKPPPKDLKFLTEEIYPSLFYFPRDMEEVQTDIQSLNTQSLVSLYSREWNF